MEVTCMMTEYDLKAKICDILYGVDFACGRANCASCPWLAKGYEECKNARKAAALVKEAVVDKEYKDWWESHIRQDLQFAKEEGFTPDCSPYYIALQYKQKAEMLERKIEQERRASVQKACELLEKFE